MWVKPMAFFRLIGSSDAIAIELTRGNASHPNVPNVASSMTHWIQLNDPRRRRIIRLLVEFQANTGRVAAKQYEIDSISLLLSTPNRKWATQSESHFPQAMRQNYSSDSASSLIRPVT